MWRGWFVLFVGVAAAHPAPGASDRDTIDAIAKDVTTPESLDMR
jgi:hypothetical protein